MNTVSDLIWQKQLRFKEVYILMQKTLSIEEANTLAAYEPLDSEFRSQAHIKWYDMQRGNSACSPCWRNKEHAVKTLTFAGDSHKNIEAREMFFDYFPLDKEESQTQVSSIATGMLTEPDKKLSLFQRASIRLRMSFFKRNTYRWNRSAATQCR